MIPSLKFDFEIRRVIFGLTAIVGTRPEALPMIVNQRMGDIVKHLALLSIKMREKRLEVLHDNEETLKDNAKGNKNIQDSDDEGEEEGMQSDGETEEQFHETLREIQKLRK